jgi:uncharacterized membrane protein
VTEQLFPWVSVALLLLAVVGIAWQSRNRDWTRDAQLALNGHPLLNILAGVMVVAFAVVMVFFGVGELEAGFRSGWGFFPLALVALLVVVFTVWLQLRPFPTDGSAEADDIE